jgi:spermidine/putrescine transport system substrate-binding protein
MIPKRGSILLVLMGLLSACAAATPAGTPMPPPLADTLILYNWADYLPQSVIDTFVAEYGVKIDYQIYDTQEEAADNIRSGKVYDVVVMPPELIAGLIKDGSLAKIDYRNAPNIKNISANFRDLVFDPGNQYSIPFHWGSTGLLVRTDLVKEPVEHWADLWRPEFAGKVALWPIPRELIPIALKSLGYSMNSTNRAELEQALAKLIDLKQHAILVSLDDPSIVPALTDGRAVIAHGWAYDAQLAIEEHLPIEYILPEEGTYLWSDSFVIPANSPHRYTAEVFINFLLRPEISARIVEESSYAIPNDAAEPLIKPDILNNPLIYPPNAIMQHAEIVMPLDVDAQNLYDDLWARFLAAKP